VRGPYNTEGPRGGNLCDTHRGKKDKDKKDTHKNKQADKRTTKQKIEEEGRGLLGNYYFIYLFILWLCCLVGLLCQNLKGGAHWTFLI